jgi:hypothetical protein
MHLNCFSFLRNHKMLSGVGSGSGGDCAPYYYRHRHGPLPVSRHPRATGACTIGLNETNKVVEGPELPMFSFCAALLQNVTVWESKNTCSTYYLELLGYNPSLPTEEDCHSIKDLIADSQIPDFPGISYSQLVATRNEGGIVYYQDDDEQSAAMSLPVPLPVLALATELSIDPGQHQSSSLEQAESAADLPPPPPPPRSPQSTKIDEVPVLRNNGGMSVNDKLHIRACKHDGRAYFRVLGEQWDSISRAGESYLLDQESLTMEDNSSVRRRKYNRYANIIEERNSYEVELDFTLPTEEEYNNFHKQALKSHRRIRRGSSRQLLKRRPFLLCFADEDHFAKFVEAHNKNVDEFRLLLDAEDGKK